jgi:hypothetical protein
MLVEIRGHARPTIFTPFLRRTMSRITKSNKLAQAHEVILGLERRFPPRMVHVIARKRYTTRQLVRLYQSQIDALAEIDHANAVLKVALAKEQAIAKEVAAMTAALKGLVHARLGMNITSWGDFGWTLPKKPGPKTVEAKLAGVRKRAERRAAEKQTKG